MTTYQKAGLLLCWAMLGALPASASQNVDEVIRLNKNGTTADILIAYIEKSSGDPRLSADDITLMEDANVPAAAIEAMLAKEKAASSVPVAGAAVTENVTVAPSADNSDISYFYDSMSHDGSWTNDAEYGWSWSPAISVSDSNWRPYVDNGSWVYTNDGWYWNSGYNWGWAAFHYGRWSHRDNRWSWHPDNVWGSSWVSWRHNDDYYGWAPLTPRARFGRTGGFDVSLTTGNFDLNIGLGERDYAFVRSNQFFDRDLNRHQLRGNEVTNIYRTTTINNGYTSENNRYINRGIPVQNVSRATKQEIKAVTIVDHSAKAGEVVRVNSVQNDRLEVFRPTLAAKASLDPVAVVARQNAAGNRRVTTPDNQGLAGEAARTNPAAERQAVRKAEAVKRVAERAAREPQLKTRPVESTRREAVDAKSVTTPVPEVRAPIIDRIPVRVPETREPPRVETRKARDEAPKRNEPARVEPRAREERPGRVEIPGRTEKPDKAEK